MANEVRERVSAWAKTTYDAAYHDRMQHGRYMSEEAAKLAKYVMEYQRLQNKPMSGYSTNGLMKTEEEIGSFHYVKVFNSICKVKDWNPMDMIYGTCYLALKNPAVKQRAEERGIPEEKLIAQMCGRALRALPSYLREHDLKCQLQERFPNAEFKQNEALDTVLHADLMMDYDNNRYFIWSFVDTSKSLRNFEDKFLGHRMGHVPEGLHVVCPFSLDYCNDYEGWKMYDSLSISQIAQTIRNGRAANYKNVENIVKTDATYFSNPKLIIKPRERVWEIEEELEIGNR